MKRLLLLSAGALLLTACASSVPAKNQVTLIVASAQTDCVGVVPQKCLLVKEDASENAWQYFYSNIEGFEYQPGYEYTLKIEKIAREQVAMDQSSIIYRLVRVEQKAQRQSDNLPRVLSMTTLTPAMRQR